MDQIVKIDLSGLYGLNIPNQTELAKLDQIDQRVLYGPNSTEQIEVAEWTKYDRIDQSRLNGLNWIE